jgi:isopentenyl diphosphate isomerase/L-lactate dehydrogenase-like FMN-dependent dehydrogenase
MGGCLPCSAANKTISPREIALDLKPASHFTCSQQVLQTARKNVSKTTWDYINGAAGSETTMRRNRYAIDSLAFLPRVLRDVSKVDMTANLLGHKCRLPLVLAPMGSMHLMHKEGAVGSSRAAGEFGVPHILSSVARHSCAEVSAVNKGLKIYQLYIRGDLNWIKKKLDEAKKAGFQALVMTVDAANYGIRDRQLLNDFERPSADIQGEDREFQAAMTWEGMAQVKKAWGGPMILKGIATAADARIAVEHGIDVVYISNHGGRELDHGRGTLDMLPEIVQAVAGRAEVWIDGGFVRGTDIVKALCLGAKAVGIARLQAWSIAAGGGPGMLQTLLNLEEEIRNCMGLIGATSLDKLGVEYLTRVTPLGPTHEHSSFRHLGADWAEGLR